MKKLIIICVSISIMLFVGCSERDIPTEPINESVKGCRISTTPQECMQISSYEEDGVKLYEVYSCNGNIFKISLDQMDLDAQEFITLRHPQRNHYLEKLIRLLKLNIVKVGNEKQKEKLINKLSAIINSNMSYNGVYNKLVGDIIPKANLWALRNVDQVFFTTFFRLHLEVNLLMEWEPDATVMAINIENIAKQVAKIIDNSIGTLGDMVACISCTMTCEQIAWNTYNVAPDGGGATYIPDYNRAAYESTIRDCKENTCFCFGCACDSGLIGP